MLDRERNWTGEVSEKYSPLLYVCKYFACYSLGIFKPNSNSGGFQAAWLRRAIDSEGIGSRTGGSTASICGE